MKCLYPKSQGKFQDFNDFPGLRTGVFEIYAPGGTKIRESARTTFKPKDQKCIVIY